MAQRIVVPSDGTVKSLENFLKRQFPIGYVRKLFRKHSVRINGRRAKPEDLVHKGDDIQLYVPFEKQKATRSQPPSVQILYENGSLLIIDKPAGLAVQEGRSVTRNESLYPWLVQCSENLDCQLQLVHRLDKDTSGTLLIAKNTQVAEKLAALFATRNVTKNYLCLIAGLMSRRQGLIDSPLPGRDNQLVPAQSHFTTLERFSDTTLLRVTIATGRLHQIRLHFAQMGHPVVMDAQHGDFAFNKRFRKEFGLKRQFLHAERLCFAFGGKTIDVKAPIPADLQDTLRKLRQPSL